ncbi:putative bifunctional diguanylate cyclase/phosphodiesterase [Jannaschia sp. R86511]|uniref:putative bifunctional diguanylate cyclase/phosphodiesterase n=1 Tax=Jannaschia sp. R86511 TaxID=3093853 RepID=UPI0036D4202E
MPTLPRVDSRNAWLVALAGTLALTVAAALVPGWRAPLVVVAELGAVVLVLVGVRLHRPRARGLWLAASLMLVCWSAGALLVHVRGDNSTASDVAVWAGQAVAVVIVVRMAVSRRRRGRGLAAQARSSLDLVVVTTVLALVGAQLVAASATSGRAFSALVVPTVDVAIIGAILVVAVSQRLSVAAHLMVAAASLSTLYDLLGAVQGQRLALSGEPEQVLGCLCVLLFGVAALHPGMDEATDPTRLPPRRPESAALLRLLPLVAVPLALWWVARATGQPALSSWVLLLAGMVVAGLSLLRAVGALRASEHLAGHDPLTDLANRRGLAEGFERTAADGAWLLLVDVDQFKQVNDTYGHDTGDALLLQVRDRLLPAVDEHDLVARLGGDEFVVLAPALARVEDAEALAQAVLHALREPVVVGAVTLQTSVSIGIAHAGPGEPLGELLTRADVAMYAAKADGRDTTAVYDPRMRVEAARRFALTAQVRRLLGGQETTDGRLEVLYQPLVRLDTGDVVGAEALVRWRHPEHGLMAPDAFLGIVTSTGLDLQLDRAVLAEVLGQQARWRSQGHQVLPVSVNLTRDSLTDPGLAAHVLSALERTGVPSQLLTLEITEHEELPEMGAAAQTLQELRDAGVDTHLDDYGTGFTSLDYLRRFPISVLKVDGSIVGAMAEGSQLVAGIAAMAAALDLDLLAEGVETEQQHRQLVDLGVRFGQGYLFSRPLSAEQFRQDVLVPTDGDERVGVPRPREEAPLGLGTT